MILTSDGYFGAIKQKIPFIKTGVRTTVATAWFSLIDIAGQPGAGTLAAGNTANGVLVASGTAGFPVINAFASGNKGALGVIEFGSSVACRLALVDRIFAAGAFSFNANVTLASQPDISGRVTFTKPDGTTYTDYKTLELWIEAVTAFTGIPTFTVTYTNQDGVTGRTTGAISAGIALTLGRMMQLPLQTGDTGIQKIESVVCTVATVGTFNVLITRPLWTGRINVANSAETHGVFQLGLPEIFATSALQLIVSADSTSSGTPDLLIEVCNG